VIPLGEGQPFSIFSKANGIYVDHAGLYILRYASDGQRLSNFQIGVTVAVPLTG